ncbi:phage tail protein [Photobacterium galatheae]|uniref:Phage tail protein n=1 Tax=Photobacterium galatheae TaxID=1654360 RepID=A0A066RYY7_9GAMM|nr:phage tail protein [Photobacterium galatheae]KDM92907.1 phage tail protein [Photobacterium galatheae]MCM0148128.1 phage tail protein [Photobacterium galatheae]
MNQNLKTVVTLGGTVDNSFGKIGSAFNESMGRATKTVKELEREQSQLTKTINRSKKAANELSLVEKSQQDAIQAISELEESRRGVNREIIRQRRELKKLDAARESQTDGESKALAEINARYAQLEASINDQVSVRDKLTGEIKKNQKAQEQLEKKSKFLRENIQDINELENSYERLGVDIRKAANEADGFSKAADIQDKFTGIATAGVAAVGSIWATTTAMTGLMTVTNENTATMVGMATAYDMSIERFNAWSGVANKAGLEGEHVGDLIEELSNKFGEFKALGEQSSVSDVFGALGIEQSMLDGLAAADQFEFIMKRLEGVADKQQAASLADMLFGGEGNKVITYIRNSGKSLNDLLKEQRQFNLLTDEGAKGAVAYGNSFKTLKTVITSAWQEIAGIVGGEMAGDIQTLSVTVGQYVRENKEAVASTLKSLVYGAKDFAVAIWNVGSAVNRVVQIFGGWETVGLAVASLLAGKLVLGLVGLGQTVFTAVKALGAMKVGMAGLNVVMAANPIGATVAAVSALIFVGIELYKNWDAVTAWFSEKLSWFQTEFPAVSNAIKTAFDWSPLGLVINNWEPLTRFFTELWGGVTGIFDAGIARISGVWDTVSGWMDSIKFWDSDTPEMKVKSYHQVQAEMAPSRAMAAVNNSYPASKGATVHQSVDEIKVYAAPGQSPEDIGRAVHAQLGGYQNSALYDLPEAG